jgi:hypothetical protein
MVVKYPQLPLFQVGPFVFDARVFAWARAELEAGLAADPDWLLIDEVCRHSTRFQTRTLPPKWF